MGDRDHVSRWAWSASFLCLLLSSSSCRVGEGTGIATGNLFAESCEYSGEAVQLDLDFFAADPLPNGGLDLRLQEGSDEVQLSNGFSIFVADAPSVAAAPGAAIALSAESGAPVRMTFYYHEECNEQELNRLQSRGPSVHFVATSGTIRFDAIYAPDVDPDQRATIATFEDVRFEDQANPDTRYATFSGNFSMLFTRGRPAQRYP